MTTAEQVLFAWLYFSVAIFSIVMVPLWIEERLRNYTAFVVSYAGVTFAALAIYIVTRDTLWPR